MLEAIAKKDPGVLLWYEGSRSVTIESEEDGEGASGRLDFGSNHGFDLILVITYKGSQHFRSTDFDSNAINLTDLEP